MADIYLREGSEVYQARLKVGGNSVRRSTGARSPTTAQQEADRLERELNDALIQPGDLTLLQGLDEMLSRPRKKPYSKNTERHYRTSATNVVAELENFVLRLLDEDKINTYIKKKLKTGKTVQLRRDLAFLSTLMRQAKRWDCGVSRNPVLDVDKSDIPEAEAREVYLQRHHYDKLLAACKTDSQRRFIILAVWTGMRHQEILKLDWGEIDPHLRYIQLDGARTKNSSPRRIPLRKDVRDTLASTPKHARVGYVFKGEVENEAVYSFKKPWAGIRKRAGMPKLRIHDLRHTFASWLLQSKVPERTVMHLMGHKTPSMTKRYSHDSLKSLEQAINQMEADTL